jgi:hypothetical protein
MAMTKGHGALTPEHAKVLYEADAVLTKAFEEAREILKRARFIAEPGDWGCEECDCASFQGRPGLPCTRHNCGHRFGLHRVY